MIADAADVIMITGHSWERWGGGGGSRGGGVYWPGLGTIYLTKIIISQYKSIKKYNQLNSWGLKKLEVA